MLTSVQQGYSFLRLPDADSGHASRDCAGACLRFIGPILYRAKRVAMLHPVLEHLLSLEGLDESHELAAHQGLLPQTSEVISELQKQIQGVSV